MDWVALLIGIGAAHAVMLTAYAAVSARRRSGDAWLASLFAILAVAVTTILITHRTEGWPESIALIFEGAAAWLAGPVLFAYVRDAMDRPLSRHELAAHFGFAVLAIVATTIALFVTPWTQVQWAVAGYELIYSVASASAFARGRRAGDRTARSTYWPLSTLVVMFSIHAGQAVRLFAPQAATDAVPIMGAFAASLILLALVLAQAQRVGGPRYARSALSRDELSRIYAAIERALDGPPPLYVKPDLSLADLAAAAGAPMHHVSQAISEVGGGTFYDLLTRRRIKDAQRRLVDPGNANVAVEALGMEAGFRSRSAFYAAFKTATGVAPAEFRRRGGSIVSGTTG